MQTNFVIIWCVSQCLIGHKYRPLALPTVIPSDDFQQIFSAAAESGLGDVNLLRSCYKENRNLQPAPQYVLLEPRRASRQYEEELEHIAKLVEYGSKVAAREGLLSDRFGTVMSAVHQQTLHALLCARQVAAGSANSPTSKFQVPGAQKFSPKKSPKLSGNPLLSSSSPLHNLNLNSNQTPTRRAKSTHRLMHQQSLQQGPTQKKIIMPQRQTSVTSNYALMQQPVDRMLCFIRQFEGSHIGLHYLLIRILTRSELQQRVHISVFRRNAHYHHKWRGWAATPAVEWI